MTNCKRYIGLLLFFLPALILYGQEPVPRQHQMHMMHHAGFDVIILKNGDLLYGLVQEVGQLEIKYKRTDIPDGPVYIVPRSDVYAISYRNQVKDILSPVGSVFKPFAVVDTTLLTVATDSLFMYTRKHSIRNGHWLAGIGFIRGFTDVDDAEDYSVSTTFPSLTLAYEIAKNENLQMGLQATVGSRKFSRQEFNSYDSAKRDVRLRENIFAIYPYLRYRVAGEGSYFRPYIIGGLGLQFSHVRSSLTLDFINNNNQVVEVKSGGRSLNIGLLLRAGTEYYLSDQWQLFLDGGVGPSIVRLGVLLHLDKLK